MPVATRHYHCQHNMHTPPLWLQNPEQRAQSKRDYLVGVCFNAKVAAQRLHGLANMGHMAQEQQLIPLLAAKARADNLCGINTLSLGNSAWALSKCDLKDHTFFAAVNAAAAKYDFKDAPAAQQEAVWCKLLLAMALLGYAYKDTTEAAAQAPLATGRNAILQHVRPQHCAQALFSLARTGLMPESTTGPALVRALLNQFFSGVHEPPDIQTDLMVTNPLWALLLLGQVKENLPLAQKLLQLVESDRVQALLTQMGLGQLLQVHTAALSSGRAGQLALSSGLLQRAHASWLEVQEKRRTSSGSASRFEGEVLEELTMLAQSPRLTALPSSLSGAAAP